MEFIKDDKFIKTEVIMQKAYELISNQRKIHFGTYHKCLFHLHTPASYDYCLFEKEKANKDYYQLLTDEELISLVLEKNVYPSDMAFIIKKIDVTSKGFGSIKEFLTYILIAHELLENEIELVVVSDHNSIEGYKKLVQAVKIYTTDKKYNIYTNIILGVEISCSDKNHIVGVFNVLDLEEKN